MGRTLCPLVALALCGCFGGTPEPPRYFEPVTPEREAKPAPLELSSLRLRTVDSAELLGDRIVWRKSDVELGVYEQERWTEQPAFYVREHLGRELFEVRRFRRTGRGAPLFLDVQLRAFEEVLVPKHEVRVSIWILLATEDEAAVLERTFEARRPVESENAEAMARAMGAALGDTVGQVADAVQATVEAAAEQAGK